MSETSSERSGLETVSQISGDCNECAGGSEYCCCEYTCRDGRLFIYEALEPKFGDDALVRAHMDPSRAQKLVADGHVITPEAILAACFSGDWETLEILLVTGWDPNSRLATADSEHTGVEAGWASYDVTPNIGIDTREWFPIHQAAVFTVAERYDWKDNRNLANRKRFSAVTTLLNYKPDLYATFKQPIWYPFTFPFPGEVDTEKEADGTPSRNKNFFAVPKMRWIDGERQRQPKPQCGYGLCTVIHSLLESAAYVKPIIEHPNLELNLEHRDPQGRTLLHAVCRSRCGADSSCDVASEDMCDYFKMRRTVISPNPSETSIFHILRKRGADLTAADYSGKSILHHLLEADDYPERRFPPICNALQYVLKSMPVLVNQKDRHGIYPLHVALQRLRRLRIREPVDDPERQVQDLLDAGADPTVRDSRGNTALHYLADHALTSEWYSERARALCQEFCACGVDVNARNKLGRTALEILMDDTGVINAERVYSKAKSASLFSLTRKQAGPPLALEEVESQVLEMFDKAGARWTERDHEGHTLLHFVAKHKTPNAVVRAEYLLNKGVDSSLIDRRGRTVADLAKQCDNMDVLEVIER